MAQTLGLNARNVTMKIAEIDANLKTIRKLLAKTDEFLNMRDPSKWVASPALIKQAIEVQKDPQLVEVMSNAYATRKPDLDRINRWFKERKKQDANAKKIIHKLPKKYNTEEYHGFGFSGAISGNVTV